MRLMTKTGIISIHSHRGTLYSLGKIIDMDEEEKRAKQEPCGTPTSNSPISESTPLTLQNRLRLDT